MRCTHYQECVLTRVLTKHIALYKQLYIQLLLIIQSNTLPLVFSEQISQALNPPGVNKTNLTDAPLHINTLDYNYMQYLATKP